MTVHLPEENSALLRALVRAAVAGGNVARAGLRRRGLTEIVQKGARDYQTEADVATERAIAASLARDLPDWALEGEEGAADRAGRADLPRLVVDPIDGTTNYAWGIPHFGVVVAAVQGDDVIAGVTYDPMLDEMFAAEAGQGAWLNGTRLQLSGAAIDPANAVIGAGLPIPGQVRAVPEATYHAALRRAMDTVAGVRRLGSSALSVAYVAAGRLDGFFEDSLSLHDYGASMLILREAGGTVTAFDGGPVRSPGPILAAAPGLRDWLQAGFSAASSPAGSSVVI